MKIYLCGRHANRTPLSYKVYRNNFSKHVTYVDKAEDADFIVLGWLRYIQEHSVEISRAVNKNPSIKVVVLSEEPLWDTMFDLEYYAKKKRDVFIGSEKISCYFLNHHTSNIFNFKKIPYYITTEPHYFVRYHSLFSQNASLSKSQIIDSLNTALIKAAFYAERKRNEKYAFTIPGLDVQGLGVYRTQLASSFNGPGIVREGLGWSDKDRRQDLPDWHLEKLSVLNRKARMVSALENTHQINYVSEKIFDAFAVLSVPIYYASEAHKINAIVNSKSYINLYNKDVAESVEAINGFLLNEEFIEHYRKQQFSLKNLFANYELLLNERRRVTTSLIEEFKNL